MWLVVLATTLVVQGQQTPTISFISGTSSGREIVTDLGKTAELICQVSYSADNNNEDHINILCNKLLLDKTGFKQ